MNQVTHHDFESEKIKIDYLTFNIKNTEYNLQKIAQFFNRVYKFNCYYYDKKIGIRSKTPYNILQTPFIRLKWYLYFTLIQEIEILF